MRGPGRVSRTLHLVLIFGLAVLTTSVTAPARATYPVLAPAVYSGFLTNLSTPVASPGSTVTLSAEVRDPATFGEITSVNLTLELYAFNAFPGNATQGLPSGPSPTFANARSSPTFVVVPLAALAPNSATPVNEPVVVPTGAPAGAYAVRTQLSFDENGSPFLLESRGYFSYASWTNATAGPNGTSVLNVSRLGVSGVLPETAVPVVNNPYPWVLAILLVGAIACAAAGGYYASRRGPGSRSGARSGAPDTKAPSALGKSRKSDGD